MKKFILNWLSCWLYVITMLSGIILGITISNWQVWDLQTKLFAFATALLPLHVLEEWHFPGGFHVMYNLMKKSNKPDSYPMNQLTDMLTNFLGVIFGCVVLFIGVNPVFMVMQLFLCCAEIFGHTSGGIFSLKYFQGKRTIYNPGLLTTIFGYLPLAIGIIISFFVFKAPTFIEIIIALLCSMILGYFSLPLPEKLFKDLNTPYGFTWGDGYFSKFNK